MDREKKLEEQISEYHELAKEDKDVDVAALMMNALENQDQKMVPKKSKKWAYLVSVGFPPFGLLFALRYYFGNEDDGKTVALICVILTVVSVAVFVILFQSLISGSGTSPDAIKQIKPSDIQQLLQ